MTISDILITALVGICVVFAVLVILMTTIYIMSWIFSKFNKKTEEPKAVAVAEKPKATTKAPGSCGDIKLNGIADRDAAMIMAIVADKLQTPLCELKFISIKEVEENN